MLSDRFPTPRERFEAWLDAECAGVALTDTEVMMMRTAFAAGLSHQSENMENSPQQVPARSDDLGKSDPMPERSGPAVGGCFDKRDRLTRQLQEAGRFLQRIASQGGPLSGNAMEMARRCIVEADLYLASAPSA